MHLLVDSSKMVLKLTLRGTLAIASLNLPAGQAVELKPGGYHVMLMQLVTPLKVGSTITLTLELKKAGAITVSVPILEQAP